MKTSPLFSLDWKDALKGLLIAVLSAVLTVVQNSLVAGTLLFNWSSIGQVAGAAAVAYLMKNFLTPQQTITKVLLFFALCFYSLPGSGQNNVTVGQVRFAKQYDTATVVPVYRTPTIMYGNPDSTFWAYLPYVGTGTFRWSRLGGGSGSGITNSAAANELMKSDGTNAVGSGLSNTVLGDLNLGRAATAGGSRSIAPLGSSANIAIIINAIGSGGAQLLAGPTGNVVLGNFGVAGGLSFNTPSKRLTGTTGKSVGTDNFTFIGGAGVAGAETGDDLIISGGNSFPVGNTNGGNLTLTGGTAFGSGTVGGVLLTADPTTALGVATKQYVDGTNTFTGTKTFRTGNTGAGTAPFKLVSGALMTAPELGAFEFLTDKAYLTITTGTARKEVTLNEGTLTSGRIVSVTTNGRLTDNANVTVSGNTITSSNGFIGAHYQTTGSAPSIAAGTGAGTTPTVSVSNAHDGCGILNITTGTTPAGTNAVIATITFATAWGVAPNIQLTPNNNAAAALAVVSQVYVTSTTTTFVLTSGVTALTASTAYTWFYHCQQ